MKTCNVCGETKSADEFNKRAASPDGLARLCRECESKEKREQRQRLRSRTDEEIDAAAAAVGSKACNRCKVVKSMDDFPRDRGRRDGRGQKCKPCATANTKHYREADPEGYRARRKASYGRNRERFRKDQLKYRFGITTEQYRQMHAAQGGVCAICGEPETRTRGGKVCDLAVDHDHATGAVRQLLCSRCNTGLGWFRDDPELLATAAEYVTRHRDAEGLSVS